MLLALLLALTIGVLIGAVLAILWFGNAVDDAAREGEERGRSMERYRHAYEEVAGWE